MDGCHLSKVTWRGDIWAETEPDNSGGSRGNPDAEPLRGAGYGAGCLSGEVTEAGTAGLREQGPTARL